MYSSASTVRDVLANTEWIRSEFSHLLRALDTEAARFPQSKSPLPTDSAPSRDTSAFCGISRATSTAATTTTTVTNSAAAALHQASRRSEAAVGVALSTYAVEVGLAGARFDALLTLDEQKHLLHNFDRLLHSMRTSLKETRDQIIMLDQARQLFVELSRRSEVFAVDWGHIVSKFLTERSESACIRGIIKSPMAAAPATSSGNDSIEKESPQQRQPSCEGGTWIKNDSLGAAPAAPIPVVDAVTLYSSILISGTIDGSLPTNSRGGKPPTSGQSLIDSPSIAATQAVRILEGGGFSVMHCCALNESSPLAALRREITFCAATDGVDACALSVKYNSELPDLPELVARRIQCFLPQSKHGPLKNSDGSGEPNFPYHVTPAQSGEKRFSLRTVDPRATIFECDTPKCGGGAFDESEALGVELSAESTLRSMSVPLAASAAATDIRSETSASPAPVSYFSEVVRRNESSNIVRFSRAPSSHNLTSLGDGLTRNTSRAGPPSTIHPAPTNRSADRKSSVDIFPQKSASVTSDPRWELVNLVVADALAAYDGRWKKEEQPRPRSVDSSSWMAERHQQSADITANVCPPIPLSAMDSSSSLDSLSSVSTSAYLYGELVSMLTPAVTDPAARAIRRKLDELVDSVDAAKGGVSAIRNQIRCELALLCFRVVSTIVDLLLPAAECQGKRVTLMYRKWICDVYRVLLDEGLLDTFSALVNRSRHTDAEPHDGVTTPKAQTPFSVSPLSASVATATPSGMAPVMDLPSNDLVDAAFGPRETGALVASLDHSASPTFQDDDLDDALAAPGALFHTFRSPKAVAPSEGTNQNASVLSLFRTLHGGGEIQPPSGFLGTRLMFSLLNGTDVTTSDFETRLESGTSGNSYAQPRSTPSIARNRHKQAPCRILSSKTNRVSVAMPHHHRFRYATVNGPSDVQQMYAALAEDAEMILSPHDPLRGAITMNRCSFLVETMQAFDEAQDIISAYLADVAEESVTPVVTVPVTLEPTLQTGNPATREAPARSGAAPTTSAFSVTMVRRSGATGGTAGASVPPPPSTPLASSTTATATSQQLVAYVPDNIPSWNNREEEIAFWEILGYLRATQEALSKRS